MPLNSVNTNVSAMVALQSLNRTNDDLAMTQKRISTGFRVADAKDDGAAFAVSQKVRADISGLTSANEQLGGVKGILDTTMSSLGKVSATMKDIRATLTKLADENVKAGSDERMQYTEQLKAQVRQVNNFLADSTYNGQSLLGDPKTTTAATDITTIRNEGGGTYTINGTVSGTSDTAGSGANSLTLDDDSATGGSGLLALTELTANDAKYMLGDSTITVLDELGGGDGTAGTFATAKAQATTFAQAQTNINNALNQYGADSKYIDAQISYNKEKMDALESGLGALVDADLAKESAKLQALQIRQQLGTQALSIANQSPQSLLSLFR